MARITVSVKIFAIAVGLLLLMSIVALLTARMTRTVDAQLRTVAENYDPAADQLARASASSLERALWLRRVLMEGLNDDAQVNELADAKKKMEAADAATTAALQQARKHINDQIADPLDFDDNIKLARLDAQLEMLVMRRDSDFRRLIDAAMIAAVAHDRAALDRILPELDRERDLLTTRLQQYRDQMQDISAHALNGTRAYQHQTLQTSLLMLLVAAALGLTVAAAVTMGVVRPIRRLVAGAAAIQRGELDTVIAVTSRDEIGQLGDAFNKMVDELRAKERIRSTFGKYLDPRIVEGLVDRPELLSAAGERRLMTVLFADMQGFTSISETTTAQALVTIVNRYLTLLSAPVREHQGVIDKYIGDAIVAYWGPPFCDPANQAIQACLAALDMQRELDTLRAELPDLLGVKRYLPTIAVRIGIATGEAVVGNIGSDLTKNYTVMGDTVNLASRLEGANKFYGTELLVNEATAMAVQGRIELREVDRFLPVGKSEPQRVYELLGPVGNTPPERLARRERFVEGLELYRAAQWDEAHAVFTALATEDPTSAIFAARVEQLRQEPPDNWTGVWTLTEK
ncbi:adenylate/guanylate cyclase domain-containing protein [Roseiterribacter gracilis]|uniref:Adenylate cyclase n=1 Tax=Roseiterribacter gracilis TaxID=2812848 RepID=A0A8S8X9H2_9PROT|nr:adenylate cyclase [Rhodospirillales bacterium TMPK1]